MPAASVLELQTGVSDAHAHPAPVTAARANTIYPGIAAESTALWLNLDEDRV